MDLLDALETRVVCGDGAMGTLLLNDGVPIERCFEELCVSEPARIQKIHEDYIAAGAHIIETNTFGANVVRLARFGMENRVRASCDAGADRSRIRPAARFHGTARGHRAILGSDRGLTLVGPLRR